MSLLDRRPIERFAKVLGYLFSFILFTIILFYIFKLTDKIPGNWGYFSFFLIGITIALIGTILKMLLK